MAKTIREIVAERLKGFEYRQEARNRARAAGAHRKQNQAMMRDYGTLRGARQYLNLKAISFLETRDPASGHVLIIIPGQVVLSFDESGKYLGSGSHHR